MKFVEQIRKKLGIKTRYSMAVDVLNTTPQQYDSLIKARDRIRFQDLIKLREVSRMSDTDFFRFNR